MTLAWPPGRMPPLPGIAQRAIATGWPSRRASVFASCRTCVRSTERMLARQSSPGLRGHGRDFDGSPKHLQAVFERPRPSTTTALQVSPRDAQAQCEAAASRHELDMAFVDNPPGLAGAPHPPSPRLHLGDPITWRLSTISPAARECGSRNAHIA